MAPRFGFAPAHFGVACFVEAPVQRCVSRSLNLPLSFELEPVHCMCGDRPRCCPRLPPTTCYLTITTITPAPPRTTHHAATAPRRALRCGLGAALRDYCCCCWPCC